MYCHSDVKLLKKGCEAFVKRFSQEADFNPFERCTTIASACNLYWRWSIKNDTEDFHPDRGLQIDMVHVRMPPLEVAEKGTMWV